MKTNIALFVLILAIPLCWLGIPEIWGNESYQGLDFHPWGLHRLCFVKEPSVWWMGYQHSPTDAPTAIGLIDDRIQVQLSDRRIYSWEYR